MPVASRNPDRADAAGVVSAGRYAGRRHRRRLGHAGDLLRPRRSPQPASHDDQCVADRRLERSSVIWLVLSESMNATATSRIRTFLARLVGAVSSLIS